jgi:hypothetical protein
VVGERGAGVVDVVVVDWRRQIAEYFEPVIWHVVVAGPFAVPLQQLQLPPWLLYGGSSAGESMQRPSEKLGAKMPTSAGDVLAVLDFQDKPPDATNEQVVALHGAVVQLEVGPMEVVLSTR